jgi:hypothetical protein
MKLATCLLRLPAVLLALPLAASATIYKWTDERGTTVFSNRQPAAEAKVSNMQVVVEDDEPARAPKQVPAAPKPDNGNALQERVRALEQQVQTLQSQPSGYAAAPQLPPPPSYYPPPDYYPPPQSYPSDYAPWMSGWGSPGWGSAGWGTPFFPAYPTIIVTGRRFFPPFVRPVPHKFVGHHFAARPVPFVARPVPVTVNRTMGVSHGMGGGGRRR